MQNAQQSVPVVEPQDFSLQIKGFWYCAFYLASGYNLLHAVAAFYFGAWIGGVGWYVFVALVWFYIGHSCKYIRYEEKNGFLDVKFGVFGFFNKYQSCCCVHRGRVRYDTIRHVEHGRTYCTDGCLVNCNRCSSDWVYSVSCCTEAVIVTNDDGERHCCHSGRRKFGVSTRAQAVELKTFLENKMVESQLQRYQRNQRQGTAPTYQQLLEQNQVLMQQNQIFVQRQQQQRQPQYNMANVVVQNSAENGSEYPVVQPILSHPQQHPSYGQSNPFNSSNMRGNQPQPRQSRPQTRSSSPYAARNSSPQLPSVRNSSPHSIQIRDSSPIRVQQQQPIQQQMNYTHNGPVPVRNASPHHQSAQRYPKITPISSDQKQPLIQQNNNESTGGHLFVNPAPNPLQANSVSYQQVPESYQQAHDPTRDANGVPFAYQPPSKNY